MRIAALLLAAATWSPAYPEVISGGNIRLTVTSTAETIEIRDGSRWVPVFNTTGAVTRTAPGRDCSILSVTATDPRTIVQEGACDSGKFRRTLSLTADPQAIEVAVEFNGAAQSAVEDRVAFAPERKADGSLDFV
jgi:hypothetical protein